MDDSSPTGLFSNIATFTSSLGRSNYHFTGQQWRETDLNLQREAGLPIELRRPIGIVAKECRDKCSFDNAARKPSVQAISKRYIKYFLGVKEDGNPLDKSLEEQANEMIERAIEGIITIDGLIARIRAEFYQESTSEVHTLQAINSRYIESQERAKKWHKADKLMQFTATKGVSIGPAIDNVKTSYFPTDHTVTWDQIQARYCDKFLGIPSTDEVVREYDNQRLAETMTIDMDTPWTSMYGFDPTADSRSIFPHESARSPPSAFSPDSQTAIDSATIISSEGNRTMASSTQQTQSTTRSKVSKEPQRNPRKRPRFETENAEIPVKHLQNGLEASPSSQAESGFRNILKALGFKIARKATDPKSLCARVKRFSLEVKACPRPHTNLSEDKRCSLCKYPKYQAKPCIWLPPEYATSSPGHHKISASRQRNRTLTT